MLFRPKPKGRGSCIVAALQLLILIASVAGIRPQNSFTFWDDLPKPGASFAAPPDYVETILTRGSKRSEEPKSQAFLAVESVAAITTRHVFGADPRDTGIAHQRVAFASSLIRSPPSLSTSHRL